MKHRRQVEMYYRFGKSEWSKISKQKKLFLLLLVGAIVYYIFLGSTVSSNSSVGSYSDGYADDDAEEIVVTELPKKKKKEKKIEVPPLKKVILETDELISASKFSRLVKPMEIRHNNLAICPNIGGGGKNRQCSKGYLEYYFKVEPGTDYYIYVETIGPNINDNSLWVGTDANQKKFLSCSSKTKAGQLVPHKHVKAGKWLCCPKYLAKNQKGGQGDFYYECCFSKLGPKGDETGCILDLEVDSKPHWNMLPRILTPESNEMMIKIYAREDGTAVTSLFVSTNPARTLSTMK